MSSKVIRCLLQSIEGNILPDCNQLAPLNYDVYKPYGKMRYINVDKKNESIKKRKLPILYNDYSECCGCAACYSICPCSGETYMKKRKLDAYVFQCQSTRDGKFKEYPQTGAITMLPDEEGFLYPVVDASVCICCYKCEGVCDFK